jgi:hypothetical protein
MEKYNLNNAVELLVYIGPSARHINQLSQPKRKVSELQQPKFWICQLGASTFFIKMPMT